MCTCVLIYLNTCRYKQTVAQSESCLKSEEYPDICSIETKKCSKWRGLEVTRCIGDSCAYLFSNSLWFISDPEGFSCIASGDLASLQSLLQDQLPLEAMGSVRGPHPCGTHGAKALLKASPPCCGTADPESSLSGIPSFPDTSHLSLGPLPVSKARLGFNSFSKDFRQPWVSAMRGNSACKTWGAVRPTEQHGRGSCTADTAADGTEAKGRVNHLPVSFSVFSVQRRWDSDKLWVIEVSLYPRECFNT